MKMNSSCSYKGIYEINLSNYKELKIDLMYLDYYELNMIAREMIYYMHLSNIIMDTFLSSNEPIEKAIEKICIISAKDYMIEAAELITIIK